MKAVTWQGKQKMEIRNVEDPKILEPTDAIIRITATAICGSDLHLYHHGEAVLEKRYVVGHEPMGIVEEVGSAVTKLKKGQTCGHPLQHQLWPLPLLSERDGKSVRPLEL